VLLLAFALIESRHRAPLVPLRFLRSRALVGANAVMLLMGALAVGVPFVLTLYAQQVLGYSALEFGVAFVVVPIAAAAGMMVSQSAVLRFGFRPVAATGMALLAAGSLALTQVSVGGSYAEDLMLGLLLFGPGIGPAFVTASIAALQGVGERDAGLASGLSNTAFQLGGALGVAILTTVAVSRSEGLLTADAGADPLVVLNEGLQSALLACVVLAAVGAALALALLGPPRKARRERLEPLAATGGAD
jgi:MFS family permease